jgi:DNA-binding MarR family transcriptional regulator
MRETIRAFTKNLDMMTFLNSHNGACISEISRTLKMPYSTTYVKIHKLEKAGLVQLEYIAGKKAVKLTEIAIELIEAMKT